MVNATTTDNPRRAEESYGVQRAIETLKAAVRIEDHARTLTALRFAGNSLRGPCPVHKGDNPESFAVYPAEQRFYCYRCHAAGDVVDLARAVEGGPLWEAVVSLADRYNVELPRPSEQRLARINEKDRIRDAATKRIAAVYQRRLTRLYAPLVMVGGETAEEELEELQELAAALWPVSLSMAGRRVSGA